MKQNCTDPKVPGHHYVGARGITYDPAWESFAAFHADMGPCPDGFTLKRIDHRLGYQPGNCEWVLLSDARKAQR
jgi:hypothetical protein